jgi:hypothetical protein
MTIDKNHPAEKAITDAMYTEQGVTAITKALGYNGDCDWDKAWEWFENPRRTITETKVMLKKIGKNIKG